MTAKKTKTAAAETQAPIKFEDIPGAELMRPIKTFTAAEQARFTGRMTAILGADFDVKNATEQEIDLSKLDFDKVADLIEWATENLGPRIRPDPGDAAATGGIVALRRLCDEYPSLDAELFLMGIKVEELSTSRELARTYALVERLKTDPESTWRAELLGSDENIRWSGDTYLLAGILNGINAQLKGKRLTRSEQVKLPTQKSTKEFRSSTVKDLDLAGFMEAATSQQ